MGLFPDVPPTPAVVRVEQQPQTVAEIRLLAKRKLMELVIPSLTALKGAIEHPDDDSAIVVKAACAVLDRAGFGVHSTITVDDAMMDIPRLTKEEHLERIRALVQRVEAHYGAEIPATSSTSVH